MKIAEYIILGNKIHSTGKATEHSYRGVLADLIQKLSYCLYRIPGKDDPVGRTTGGDDGS